MDLFDDIRDPRTPIGKIAYGLAALLLFSLLALLAISGSITYRALSPLSVDSELDPAGMIGNPEAVPFQVPGGSKHEGWLFPGLRGAPTIILCHAYQSNRAEMLTMAAALQTHQFNVFVFDFSGHGASDNLTSLGPREGKEVLAAINELAQRDDVDRERFGIWGANLGGYAAVAAAAEDSRIKAIAVESVYDSPRDMLRVQVGRSGLANLPLVERMASWEYTLLNFSVRNAPPASQLLPRLNSTAKFFIQARDSAELAESTLQLFLKAPEPKQQAVVQKSNYSTLMEDERREYDSKVVNFFLQHLPVVRR